MGAWIQFSVHCDGLLHVIYPNIKYIPHLSEFAIIKDLYLCTEKLFTVCMAVTIMSE